MLIILFGLAGAGKNFVGEILSQEFDFYYWDADQILTKSMLEAIKHKAIFSQQMRDDFTQSIIANIPVLRKKSKKIVISQALYKEQNRIQLLKAFPDACFVHVVATDQIRFERIKNRDNSVTEDYAALISTEFELPQLKHHVINNIANSEYVTKQLMTILHKKTK